MSARLPPRPVSRRRWRFAQLRQRLTQARKALAVAGDPAAVERHAVASSARVRRRLADLGLLPEPLETVVEVGSGAHGLIWRWPSGRRVAIDPLADFYRRHFAFLQADGPRIVTARGEELPLAAGAAALVLSDNVLDHVEDPRRVLAECARVLCDGGVLYLAVDVHHPLYARASALYNRLFELGLRAVVPAFPSHPFHFRRGEVEALLEGAGFELRWRTGGRGERPRASGSRPYDLLKRLFYKNARSEMVAVKGAPGAGFGRRGREENREAAELR